MSAPTSTPQALEAPPVSDGPIAKYARLTGALLVVLGVLGLVPGVTTSYDELGVWGSGAQLFGVFTTSITGSAVLILLGVTCVTFSGSPRQGHKAVVWSCLTLVVAGIAGAGLVVNSPEPELPVDAAANWLHLVLGLVLLAGAKGAKSKYCAGGGVI